MALHKWLVLAASTTVTLLVFGFILAFGNLFTDMIETFEATRSEVGAVQSVMLAFTLATGKLREDYCIVYTCYATF